MINVKLIKLDLTGTFLRLFLLIAINFVFLTLNLTLSSFHKLGLYTYYLVATTRTIIYRTKTDPLPELELILSFDKLENYGDPDMIKLYLFNVALLLSCFFPI